jgi:hypothetical protein
MGRKKRAIHPWSARDPAMAACVKALGGDAVREAIECFEAVSHESSEYGPSSDEFIAWAADLLSGVERKYRVRITGGLATLLWISSGARPLASEDRFERSRKTWDEAMRRARKRERIGGPGLFHSPVARFHGSLVWLQQLHGRRRPQKPSFERLLGFLEFELEELGRDAQRLSLRDVKALLRGIQRVRAYVRVRSDA